MREAIEKLSNFLRREKNPRSIVPFLSPKEHEPVPFSPDNYRPIEKKENTGITEMAFIDGGQAELLSSADFSLSFVRTVACVYEGRKKTRSVGNEFFLLVLPKEEKNDISYSVEIFPRIGSVFPNKDMLSFSSTDRTLRSGIRKVAPSSIISAARRFAELGLAISARETMAGGMIFLDGTLQKNYTGEEQLLSKLQFAVQGNAFIGVNKTNSLLTQAGESFGQIVLEKGPQGAWWYAPVARPKKGMHHFSFAKFHPRAAHAFLLESFSAPYGELYSAIAPHAQDPIFLGYPYGLIEADRAARVENQEAQYLKTKLIALMGNSTLQRQFSAKSAHGILDSMRF